MKILMRASRVLVLAIGLAGAFRPAHHAAAGTASSDSLPVLDVPVFAAPSQSVWLPVLIQKTGLDIKHGFRLQVTEKPGPVAYADFASGAARICYCAAPAGVARFVEQGSDITLLWNVFDLDFWIVTKDPKIRSPGDLAGKVLAADTSTGSWAVTAFLLQQHGLDLGKVSIQSVRGTAMIAELAAGRVDAIAAQPIDVATIETQSPGQFHGFSVFDAAAWHKYAASPGVPSIAMGVWRDWLKDPAHVAVLKKLYAANVEAASYVRTHPEQAAALISSGTPISQDTLLYAFRHFPNIIDVRPIDQYKGAVRVLVEKLLPAAGQLERPMTQKELDAYVSDFQP